MPSAADEVLELNRRLLTAVASGDWKTYCQLVAEDITCFEPEARGHLVEGLPFHEFYFKLPAPVTDGKSPPPAKPVTTTMTTPTVKLLAADVALVAYVRLTQTLDDAGKPVTRSSEETRLWQKQAGHWKHVHFHRSLPS
jgi:calcium/calmodulin-dependent protein kinase (CaM kinase) II